MRPHITSSILAVGAAAIFSTHAFAGDVTDTKKEKPVKIEETKPASRDLISIESSFTGSSNVRQALPIANQNVWYNSFDYAHRIHVKDNWYFRVGVQYQRYDFGGSNSPLPQHLQAVSAIIAYEYVVQDIGAVAIELRPGFAFEDQVKGRNFSVPLDAYFSFKIKENKVFGVAGAFYGENFSPMVTPIGGVIWLINDKVRLEATFPRPAVVYNMNEDWEFRAGLKLGGYGFRVDQDRAAANYPGSVLMYTYYEVGAQATYKGWKPFEVALGAGWSFKREFDFFRDGPGQKYNAAGAPFISLSLNAKF